MLLNVMFFCIVKFNKMAYSKRNVDIEEIIFCALHREFAEISNKCEMNIGLVSGPPNRRRSLSRIELSHREKSTHI